MAYSWGMKNKIKTYTKEEFCEWVDSLNLEEMEREMESKASYARGWEDAENGEYYNPYKKNTRRYWTYEYAYDECSYLLN